jgi:hypothetical protein
LTSAPGTGKIGVTHEKKQGQVAGKTLGKDRQEGTANRIADKWTEEVGSGTRLGRNVRAVLLSGVVGWGGERNAVFSDLTG